MATKSYIQKDGTIWEWEDSIEVIKAVEIYWNLVKENESN